jgi:protein Mpv17
MIFHHYRRVLNSHPYLANAATSGLLMFLGDRLAQHVERRQKIEAGEAPLTLFESASRSAILTTWSACIASPFWLAWYRMLPRVLPHRQVVWTLLTAAVPAPISNCAFFTYSTVAEHCANSPQPIETLDEALAKAFKKIETQLVPTIQMSAALWIPVNLANYYFTPLEFRMLATSVVAFVWNAYLSILQHKPVVLSAREVEDSHDEKKLTIIHSNLLAKLAHSPHNSSSDGNNGNSSGSRQYAESQSSVERGQRSEAKPPPPQAR